MCMNCWAPGFLEEGRCNFPQCVGGVDSENWYDNGVIIKNGQILAFCKEHQTQLVKEGIAFSRLTEEIWNRVSRNELMRMKTKQSKGEKAFLKSLKS